MPPIAWSGSTRDGRSQHVVSDIGRHTLGHAVRLRSIRWLDGRRSCGNRLQFSLPPLQVREFLLRDRVPDIGDRRLDLERKVAGRRVIAAVPHGDLAVGAEVVRVAADHVLHRQAFRDRKDSFEHAAESLALAHGALT